MTDNNQLTTSITTAHHDHTCTHCQGKIYTGNPFYRCFNNSGIHSYFCSFSCYKDAIGRTPLYRLDIKYDFENQLIDFRQKPIVTLDEFITLYNTLYDVHTAHTSRSTSRPPAHPTPAEPPVTLQPPALSSDSTDPPTNYDQP